ncbi:MAG TPA: lamin tail domain-containing protein, partial [Anaeromyxobacter sp.]
MSPRGRVTALALALDLAGACGLPDPAPLPRIVGAAPEGSAVPVTTAAEVWFSAPVDPEGLLDGRRLVLAEAAALREALAAVDADA